MILARLLRRAPNPAQPLYEAIVAAARQPIFYTSLAVPDTVDGRFDMVVLHLSLVLERLSGGAGEVAQKLVNQFCADMDGNLREMGAGDLSVGKKVRHMAEALQGRHQAYLAAQDLAAMGTALQRNVYAGKPAPEAENLAHYVLQSRAALQGQDPQAIAAGEVAFA